MVSAGRVLIMPKGDYSAEASYEMLDLVSYNGSSYIAKKSTTGNLPTNTTYWQLSAYGGSAANLAGNFATLETTDYASQDYVIDAFLVTKNSQFCKVTAAITEGDELVVGSEGNLETTTVGDMMQALADYADSLDANNMQLKGMTAITAQTDLDDMTTIGNYYKSATNFYVTNAPTGIASELTAIFRLTVENGSDTTNKYIQTLRTNDGKTYTRAYNGSAWSTWVEFASAASVALKQPKTLDTPITVAGVQQTTCEGALGALNSALTNEIDKAYQTDDAAITEVASDDLLPIYDTSATGKKKIAVSSFIGGLVSNPNLLDNAWFTVNQRGQSSYTNSSYTREYSVDRWFYSRGTLSVTNDGVTYASDGGGTYGGVREPLPLEQFEKHIGQMVTASICYKTSDNNAFRLLVGKSLTASIGTKYLPSTNGEYRIEQLSVVLPSDISVPNTGIDLPEAAEKSIDIKCLKLELGSVSTLAMDTAPNYATELLKCQSYFQVIAQGNRYRLCQYGGGGMINISLPVPMRALPTMSNTTFYLRSMDLQTESVVSSQAVNPEHNYNELLIILGLSSWNTDGQAYLKDGDLWLSADL